MLHHYPEPGIDCRPAASRRWWQALTAPELRLVICCDELEVFMFSRQWLPGRARQLIGHQRYPLAGNAQEAMPPEILWQTLRDVLAPLTGQRWHVVVVLSNQYARWLALPWQSEIRSQADRQAYYRHGLQQAFGQEMQDWHIEAHTGGFGQHTLVNALPVTLITQLQGVCAEYQLLPGMIAPAWMLAANQALHMLQRQKNRQDGWVVCRESNSLTLACLIHGDWQHIRYVPVDAHWRQTLQQVLLREQVMYPQRAALPVYLPHAQLSGISRDTLAPFTVVDVKPLQGLGESFNQLLRRKVA
ncbi:hypothetical protein SAMN05192566_0281 [Methylophilus rhizosphaerae]|uniref:Uncharacterized protein n=1 Tax=Methylophilus rhizosphaerae TaxID=492660 RepID=A0A1G8ZHJ8_9PROT|nr:hypothetical protein [Methylophilus rhizosphaerae]SDK13865.1 hypothetical protein SAMN05192566_0281 [Methylophilus rhizosphaerae]